MKKTLMLSFFVVSLVAAAGIVNDARLAERRAEMHNCSLNPYNCFSPAVSFASLH